MEETNMMSTTQSTAKLTAKGKKTLHSVTSPITGEIETRETARAYTHAVFTATWWPARPATGEVPAVQARTTHGVEFSGSFKLAASKAQTVRSYAARDTYSHREILAQAIVTLDGGHVFWTIPMAL